MSVFMRVCPHVCVRVYAYFRVHVQKRIFGVNEDGINVSMYIYVYLCVSVCVFA